MPNPRVLIIGGGFAGLNAAQALADAPVSVTLIDRRNHHLFQPLLYQVATAGLSPSDIASPIRRILRNQSNAEVLLAQAFSVDLNARTVLLDSGSIAYDYLIVATGARHSYFGKDEWATFAPGLKSVSDALEIRKRILSAYEMAERETNEAARNAWLTFVVVGGGPTGVELSGALCEIAHHSLSKDFRHIDPKQARIILLEGEDRVLPPYPRELSEKARQQLVHLGVDVRTSQRVTQIDAEGVNVGDQRIAARTVLWAAGVQASRLGRELGAPHDKVGRVLVEPDLCARTSRGVCRRRYREYQDRRQTRARRRAGRDPGGKARRGQCASADRQETNGEICLPRQRLAGDDRSLGGRRGPRQDQTLRHHRLARVALHPPVIPDRLPQPSARADSVGLVVLLLRPRRSPHHRPAAIQTAGGKVVTYHPMCLIISDANSLHLISFAPVICRAKS
jgi:NADH dehydrogenase FAD-containing subunit